MCVINDQELITYSEVVLDGNFRCESNLGEMLVALSLPGPTGNGRRCQPVEL